MGNVLRRLLAVSSLVVLLIATIPTISAGPSGVETSPPPLPPGNDRDAGGTSADGESGGMGLLDEEEGEGPVPPSPPEVEIPPLTPPDPNLVVALLHPDRDVAGNGTPLHVYVVVENVGFRWLNGSWIALYDDGELGAVLLGEANVTVEDFRGAADFSWTPTTLGNHTIRAVADPYGFVEETNETDNERSVVVQVVEGIPLGPPYGKPDLDVGPTDLEAITDVEANVSASINVTVRNVGNADAADVLVEVWEEATNVLVANYTIVNVSPATQDVHTIAWIPNGTGAKDLVLRVDPGDKIGEHNESNNVAVEGFDVRPAGPLSVAEPPHVWPWCPRAVVWGDWFVPEWETVTVEDCFVRVLGNVIVEGILYLRNVTLQLPARSNHRYRVEVKDGGFLSFDWKDGNGSHLTPAWEAYCIDARALAGSAFRFLHSEARWLCGKPDPLTPGGLQVYTGDVAIGSSSVRNGQGNGLFVGRGVDAGLVWGNAFAWNQGAGIALAPGANATILGNALMYNRHGVYANDASPVLTSNGIAGNTYGLFFDYRSSAVLSGNEIQRNDVGIFLDDAWDRPVPVLAGVEVLNSTWCGVYAWTSNLTLTGSKVWNDYFVTGFGGVGVFVDFEGTGTRRSHPTIVGNTIGSYLDYFLVVWRVVHANLSDNYFRIAWEGVWVMDSEATVHNNTWSEAYECDPGCHHFVDWYASSRLTWNRFDPVNAANLNAVASVASTTRLANDSFLPSRYHPYDLKYGVYAEQGSYVEIDNATFDQTIFPICFVGGSWGIVKESEMWRVPPTEHWSGAPGVYVRDAAPWTFIRHNTFTNYAFGIYLLNATALVEWNDFAYRHFPPEFPWQWNKSAPDYALNNTDKGHVCVYDDAFAILRHNVMRGGAWAVSVDDTNAAVLANAVVEDNDFHGVGFVGIGVARHSRIDARDNRLNDSGNLALWDGHAFSAEFTNNTVTRCHGRLGPNYVRGCVGYQYDPGAVGYRPPGWMNVTWNNVTDVNWTGMMFLNDGHIRAANNTFLARIRPGEIAEVGISIAVPTIPVTVEGNAISGFLWGIRVKSPGAASPTDPGHDIGPGNVLANNTEGILIGWGDVANGYTWADVHDNSIRDNAIGVNASAANWSPTEGPYSAAYPGRATLRRNTIENNTYGVLACVFIKTYDVTIVSPYVEVWDNNTIAGNAYGVYLKGGYLPNGTLYPVWADVSDNNTFSGNGVGIWVDAETVKLSEFRVWWNDVRENAGYGMWIEGDPNGTWGDYFHAECNWWDDVLGPDDDTDPFTGPPDQNDNDPGQDVSDYFHYRADAYGGQYWWLNNTSSGLGTVCGP